MVKGVDMLEYGVGAEKGVGAAAGVCAVQPPDEELVSAGLIGDPQPPPQPRGVLPPSLPKLLESLFEA